MAEVVRFDLVPYFSSRLLPTIFRTSNPFVEAQALANFDGLVDETKVALDEAPWLLPGYEPFTVVLEPPNRNPIAAVLVGANSAKRTSLVSSVVGDQRMAKVIGDFDRDVRLLQLLVCRGIAAEP
ncbi:MAG TPA: hypothetical protein VED63_06255 [Acidimicrobiales bacterium]|nr:hypothetical protein [Acidimicrobiales bacterium]